jgi:hypothetical protein
MQPQAATGEAYQIFREGVWCQRPRSGRPWRKRFVVGRQPAIKIILRPFRVCGTDDAEKVINVATENFAND